MDIEMRDGGRRDAVEAGWAYRVLLLSRWGSRRRDRAGEGAWTWDLLGGVRHGPMVGISACDGVQAQGTGLGAGLC